MIGHSEPHRRPPLVTDMKSVLVIEDDAHIAEIVALHLRDEGYHVAHATDGDAGLRLIGQGRWDALVLDLMLPGVDGLEICRRVRAMPYYTPMIITSARGNEIQRVLGLEVGADDYLAKPFSVLELVARLKALLRRVDALARSPAPAGALRVRDLAIFPLERKVTLAGESVDLTPREFDLLCFFASHPGKVFSRAELLDRVWGYRHSGYEHTVNTHINRVRAKIETDPADPRRIVTVWGRGYKLALEEDER
jgi:DNA-binding response OmpR family regulator